MMWRAACRCLLAALLAVPWALSGCAGTRRAGSPDRSADTTGKSAWEAIDAGKFRVQLTHLASLGNTGLQLPLASPDGRWVAACSCPNTLALDPDALLTGRTISDLTLVLYSTTETQIRPRIVAVGAAWPVWAPDSKRLVAVTYDDSGRCGLLIHDIATSQTRRLKIGLPHIVTPAISPQGQQLALASFADTSEEARIYIYDLESGRLMPLPPPQGAIWQVTPMWVNEQALMYFSRVGGDTGILGANTDATKPHTWLAKAPLPLNAADVLRTQAGIAHPLSPDGHRLAMYDPSANRVVLHNLDDPRSWPLNSGSQTGCWTQPAERFVYAADRQLLVSNPQGESHVLATSAFLPLWCESEGKRLVLLTPGQKDWTFDLLRMQIMPSP